MLKENIQIPSFVKKLSDEELIDLSCKVASGRIKMYGERKELKNNEEILFERFYLNDDLNEEKEEILDEYKKKIEEYKLAKKSLNLFKLIKLRKQKEALKKEFKDLEKNQKIYTSYITGSEEKPSLMLCKEDLAQTARDITSFRI